MAEMVDTTLCWVLLFWIFVGVSITLYFPIRWVFKKLLLVFLVILVCGCANQTLPLTHTSPSDPIWAINPDKWSPPGGNNLTQPPTVPAGRIPTRLDNG